MVIEHDTQEVISDVELACGLDIEISLFMRNKGTNEEQIISNNDLRRQMVGAVLNGQLPVDVAGAAGKLINDMDKSIFTQQRLIQDKQIAEDSAAVINQLFVKMVEEKGVNFQLTNQQPVQVVAQDKELLIHDPNEFQFKPNEAIQGLDTDNSYDEDNK